MFLVCDALPNERITNGNLFGKNVIVKNRDKRMAGWYRWYNDNMNAFVIVSEKGRSKEEKDWAKWKRNQISIVVFYLFFISFAFVTSVDTVFYMSSSGGWMVLLYYVGWWMPLDGKQNDYYYVVHCVDCILNTAHCIQNMNPEINIYLFNSCISPSRHRPWAYVVCSRLSLFYFELVFIAFPEGKSHYFLI